jgi:hypothetical protein
MTELRQMRRHSRRMRRYGLQPMVVINSDRPLPDVVMVLVARWLWRYRSELAPLTLTVTVALSALVLHAWHAASWPLVLGATVPATAGVATFGRRPALAKLGERIYAASVTGVAGGWLAAAIAAGPTRPPLVPILLIGAAMLAVPWWVHRRRRARVRVERTLAAWPDIAKAVGLPGSRVMSAVVDVWGWRARFGLARGQTIDDVIAKLPAIESGLGTFRGAARAYPTPDGKANRFQLRILERDPHADAIPWPGHPVTSITQPIDLGPFEDATPARVLFLRRHGLLGGTTGVGKSGGVNVLMANLSACRDVVIWAIDLKRGMELLPWVSCIDRLATTPEQARALLRDAVAVLEARASDLARHGQRVWEPTSERPALVVIVDEYAELADDAPDAVADADSVGRRGRAVAVTLIVATQRPTQKVMGHGALRSQIDIRISFRVREARDVDLILGQGMLKAGWHAHKLDAPGKFYLSAPDHDIPQRARAYLITDDTVAETARRHADHRPALDEISRTAIEETRTPHITTSATDQQHGGQSRPEVLLWTALSEASDDGVSVPTLMAACRMSRPWIYQRLQDLARRGLVTQVSRGRWRTATDHTE